MTEGKVWGETSLVFQNKMVAVHCLEIKKGGFSSEHRHWIKTNHITVLRGELIILTWRDSENPSNHRKSMIDQTRLRAGGEFVCAPGIWHQFQAVEDSEVIEIYTAELLEPDIERRTRGGMKTIAELKAMARESE